MSGMDDEMDFHAARSVHSSAATPLESPKKLPSAPDMPKVVSSVLEALAAEDGWRQDKLHASDLGAAIPGSFGCLRKLWLRVHGVKGRPLSPGQRLLLEWAKGAHVKIQEWLSHPAAVEALAAQGWGVVSIEEDVTDDGGDGRLDVLLRHESGTLLVWDIKTAKGASFFFLERSGTKPEHMAQVRHYMRAKGAELGCVSVFDREGSRFMWHGKAFGRDDEGVEKLWQRLRTHVERPEPPDPLPPKQTKEGPDLPAPCSYSTANGDTFSCPFLDTEHCPGAVPREARPARRLVSAGMKWVTVEQPKARLDPKGQDSWETMESTKAQVIDLMQALKDSLKKEKKT